MSDKGITNEDDSGKPDQPKYNYRDTEFQIVHELFSLKEGKYNNKSGKIEETEREKPRFMEIFSPALITSKKEKKDVALIIVTLSQKGCPS